MKKRGQKIGKFKRAIKVTKIDASQDKKKMNI